MERTDPRVQPPHRHARLSGAAALRCHACGAEPAPGEPYPFRCPGADTGDDRDHLLVRVDGLGGLERELRDGRSPQGNGGPRHAGPCALATDASAAPPFLRYRGRLWFHAFARDHGVSDVDVVAWIEALDRAVAAVDGHGLEATPAFAVSSLAARLGMDPGMVWVKDETHQVAGSHKARHLFAIALALEALERCGRTTRCESDRRGLAIASCGNAALAAAVIARAAGRPLSTFVPPDADPGVRARLRDLGATVVECVRAPGQRGDPCLTRFRDACRDGAIPFCCQGSENGLAVEGGRTLAWELAESLAAAGVALDRLFVQVGGGALASACIEGMREAVAAGALPRMPRIHAVQPASAGPLARAYDRLRVQVLGGTGADPTLTAEAMRTPAQLPRTLAALRHAALHRSPFMRPLETAPRSIATGIIDDETYDWWAVLAGMVETGGWPVLVSEDRLGAAHRVARESTGIAASATGTAGLAGLMELRARDEMRPDETVAVLFTGVER